MLKGKIIAKGKIKLLSPAMIGSGESEASDMDVLRDENDIPYIPATSFAGVLRHITMTNLPQYREKLEEFWGPPGESENPKQSSIFISDMLPEGNPKLDIRDGVRINRKTQTAEEGAKFDYEIIDRGAVFNFSFEINLNGENDDFKKSMLSTIIKLLQEQRIRIGGRTNNGFGKIKLEDIKIHEFDFTNRSHVLNWFKFIKEKKLENPTDFNYPFLEFRSKDFSIEASFVIKNSLIVRDYNINPNEPDVVHICSDKIPILPGSSLKGAIRARAERIVNTLGKSNQIIKELFGDVDTNEKNKQKGKIIIEEAIIRGYPMETQTRIKIDRFTGGTIEGALADIKPLFSKDKPDEFNISIKISNFKKHEAGLMLLVLKDLWTGDLPIGGEKSIGRGVLKGKWAKISWDSKSLEFKNPEALTPNEKQILQDFVDAFVKN